MNRKKIISSLTGLAMFTLPFAALADTNANAEANGGLFINGSGIVHAIRAEVTAISGSVISAISHFGSNVINWSITTNADTKFGKNATSSASIAIGDKINVSGALTGVGSTFSVTANKVKETGSKFVNRVFAGTIASLNAGLGTFTVTHGNTTANVQTNASTTFSLDGVASAFPSLFVGEKVKIVGSQNASTSILTATQVLGHSAQKEDNNPNDDKDRDGNRGAKIRSFLQLHFGRKDN